MKRRMKGKRGKIKIPYLVWLEGEERDTTNRV